MAEIKNEELKHLKLRIKALIFRELIFPFSPSVVIELRPKNQ
jgi:hypothetical protein